MKRAGWLTVGVLWLGLCSTGAWAQPFTPQLKTDPDVGNLLGVQRYGRPLRSDPDQGEGFSYRVFPLGYLPSTPAYQVPVAAAAGQPILPPVFAPVAPALPGQKQAPAVPIFTPMQAAAAQLTLNKPTDKVIVNSPLAPGTPYDPTHGMRNYAVSPEVAAAAITMGVRPDSTDPAVLHQEPLIQIKVRVIEVDREHQLDVASVLDYISQNPATASASFITGNNLNGNKQNTTAAARFAIPGVLGVNGTALTNGQGLVINLTGQHINYIASLLQTEFRGDLITAPQVTTLNNQNVEFISGSKQPFAIGQNIITGETNNVQQFFYKHVGAYVSVTPRLVYWNRKDRRGGVDSAVPGGVLGCDDDCLRWHENPCTIDLSIIVRLSDAGKATITTNGQLNDVTFEDNVRSVANVVQVKSGEGIVMAGLIGDKDQKSESKIPFLGDIPGVGFLFRSKTTVRTKTETLIFVEARVLDPEPCVARQQTYEDFLLGQPYVYGSFLQNPLEEGMARVGFGNYLPPLCPAEARYWQRLGLKIRTVATKLDDITE